MKARALPYIFLFLVSSLSVATAQVPEVKVKNPSVSYLREKTFLEHEMQKWRKAFHMENLSIQITPMPQELLTQMCEEPCVGVSVYDPTTKKGLIGVLERSEYSKAYTDWIRFTRNVSPKQDQQDTVLHEMLHYVTSCLPKEEVIEVLTGVIPLR